MERNRIVMFALFWVLVCQLFTVDAALTYADVYCVGTNFNYTKNSKYEQNLNLILSNLPSHATSSKFYNTTAGDLPNKVYGMFQCRQDLSQDVCSRCIQDASQKILTNCTFFGEAIIWYYECMLRYSNRDIFSLSETFPMSWFWSTYNVSDFAKFAPVLGNTMDTVIAAAAASSPSGHFATGEANVTFIDKLYCLAQCTPDIDKFDCNSCLRSLLSKISSICPSGCVRALIFSPSCNLRYDMSPFVNDTSKAAAPPSKSPSSPGIKLKTSTIAGIATASVGLLLVVVITIWVCLSLGKANEPSIMTTEVAHPEQSHDVKLPAEANSLGDTEFEQYDFATLQAATRGFSIDHKLGEGGFGAVYKGVLKTGQTVAIKRLAGNSGQGAKEFMTEARIVAKLQHRNLVRFVGFCSEGDEKLLVYEFMPNTSLDHILFDPRKRASLDWGTRSKIIKGVARGLQYLHEDSRLTIIHRDLKTSNILLDHDMNPKIADFGMAKLFGGEQNYGNTSRIVGTYGYMAPEYMLSGEYSEKSDVYSFGILVLEIISGQKNRVYYQAPQREDLPIYAWKLWKSGQTIELMDPILVNKCSTEDVMRCIQVGLLCVQGNPAKRPTMGRVMFMLSDSLAGLPTPSSPAMPSQDIMYNGDVGVQGYTNVLEQSAAKSVFEQDLYPR